jgi:hypothetical protein
MKLSIQQVFFPFTHGRIGSAYIKGCSYMMNKQDEDKELFYPFHLWDFILYLILKSLQAY